MTGRPVSREVQALIVGDLARGHRSVQAIADRHRVPAHAVTLLRDQYGPDLSRLAAAAAQLRRPLGRPTEDPGPATPTDIAPGTADVPADAVIAPTATPEQIAELVTEVTTPRPRWLTGPERSACRAWAVQQGLTVKPHGNLPREVVAAWTDAGRPDLEHVNAPDPTPCPRCGGLNGHHGLVHTEAGGNVPCPAATPPPMVFAGDPQLDALDDLIFPPSPSPEPQPPSFSTSLPAAGEELPATGWEAEWRRASQVPGLRVECRAVVDAVAMLLEGLAEHDRREGLVDRVAALLARHAHLEPRALASAVLDEIEAA